jgi:hypothetical protein
MIETLAPGVVDDSPILGGAQIVAPRLGCIGPGDHILLRLVIKRTVSHQDLAIMLILLDKGHSSLFRTQHLDRCLDLWVIGDVLMPPSSLHDYIRLHAAPLDEGTVRKLVDPFGDAHH